MERCLSCMREYDIEDKAKGKDNTCPFCGYVNGSSPEEIYHLYPGTVLRDRYILGVAIGFGGFGITYKAWDKSLDTVVAIKEYYPTTLVQRVIGENNVSIYAKSKKKEFYAGMTRFMSEAKNMAHFSEVPNIVHVNNYFEENNTAYIVMEYLDGITLKDMLEEKGKLTDEETLKIIFPIMDALHVLHEDNILHRDVSPDNIFICNDGQIKLIDFGAARFSDVNNEMTRSIVLKAGYAPVEQYRAKSKQGPFTDIYAVGATIYKCITGIAPEESVSRAGEDDLKSPEQLDDRIPKYISEAVMKAMAINEELRFGSIPQFKKALQKKKIVKNATRQVKARKLRRAIIIMASIILICIGGIGAYKYYRYRSDKIELERSTISIWVPVQVSEDTMTDDIKAAEEQVLSMSEKFLQEQENVTIEVTAIPDNEYCDKLDEAAANGTLPTLFISDKASENVLNKTVAWNDVYDYLDTSNCYFLDDYKKKIEEGKQFPTAFTVPVVYVRRTNGIDMNSVEVNDYSQLSSGASKGFYIDYDSYAMFLNSLGGKFCYGDKNVIDEKSIEILEDFNAEFDSKEYDIEDTNLIYNAFEEGNITYYLASTDEYNSMRQALPGLYSIRPVTTDKIYGEFSRMWSIGDGANEEEILAAKVLMNYFLAERPQKALFVSKQLLPLNKNVFISMTDIDENYEIILDYPEKMYFDYGKQTYLDELEEELYYEVIAGDESVDAWSEK